MIAVIDIALNSPEIWNAIFIGIAGVVIALKTGKLSKELRPNGGTSLRDAVDRIERRLSVHEDNFEKIAEKLEEIAGSQANAPR